MRRDKAGGQDAAANDNGLSNTMNFQLRMEMKRLHDQAWRITLRHEAHRHLPVSLGTAGRVLTGRAKCSASVLLAENAKHLPGNLQCELLPLLCSEPVLQQKLVRSRKEHLTVMSDRTDCRK